jgi:hypothetical protein
MGRLRLITAIARADFRERTRRYGFLVTLFFVLWLAWMASEGRVRMQLGSWRGLGNSAWIGGQMTAIATTFLTLIGFYLVRGAVGRDRETGVGEILATTPMGRPAYLVGKLLSGFVYLGTMVVLLAIASLYLVARNGETGTLDLADLWLPFLLFSLPAMALTAGAAVLFDVLPGLRGGFGNVAWFFAWGMALALGIEAGPACDWSGIVTLRESMRAGLHQERGVWEESFQITIEGGTREATQVFTWEGMEWTAPRVAARAGWLGAALLLALSGVPLFDRFDPARRLMRPRRPAARQAEEDEAEAPRPARVAGAHASALPAVVLGRAFPARVRGELGRVLRGRRWWWWLMSAGVLVAGLAVGGGQATPAVLGALWPVLVWSRLGAPDAGVAPVVLSCAHPVRRGLAASFAAGVLIGLLFALGPLLRAALSADATRLTAGLASTFFPPALALAAGAWAGSPKVFEGGYTALWYVAAQTPSLDFLGATPQPNPWPFLASVPVFLALAAAGRARALR